MPINFLTARWQNLVMANYKIDPALLTPWLPPGTVPDFYEGSTYVSLVGFLFTQTRVLGLPAFKWGSFEEVNLRFYVTRTENDGTIKRGVVFINETVPWKLVALTANWLYSENYTVAPMHRRWDITENQQHIQYYWQRNGQQHCLGVTAGTRAAGIQPGSLDEFILEHYFGYTTAKNGQTIEYAVRHPRWRIFPVYDYHIQCNFSGLYGSAFACLNSSRPHSVNLAEGSKVSIPFKRKRLPLY